MRVAVFGAGGVGAYFGGRLAVAGHEVSFIARGAHLEALRAGGLSVESVSGDFEVAPVEATDQPEAIGPVDVVLVTVKAWQVRQAAKALRPLLGEATVVLPLQNGVEAPSELAEEIGAERVLGGLCKIISEIVGPGRIRHFGAEPYIALGEIGAGPGPRTEALRLALQEAGVTAEIPRDIEAAMWEKFVFIAAVSGVGAVTRETLGILLELPETRRLLVGALEETRAVAEGLGIPISPDIVGATLTFLESLPPHTTASMQRDLMDGRPSELEYQNGSVVRLGRRAGVATPLHGFLYASLLPMELKARGLPAAAKLGR